MNVILIQFSILLLVVLVIIAEMYKIRFESSQESKDERGLQLMYQSKSLSYSILSGGIALSVILVAILKLVPQEYFIFLIMVTYFIQSIISSIFLYRTSKI